MDIYYISKRKPYRKYERREPLAVFGKQPVELQQVVQRYNEVGKLEILSKQP